LNVPERQPGTVTEEDFSSSKQNTPSPPEKQAHCGVSGIFFPVSACFFPNPAVKYYFLIFGIGV
jgi:hypothetical protein